MSAQYRVPILDGSDRLPVGNLPSKALTDDNFSARATDNTNPVGAALSATYASKAATLNNFTGKIEIDGGFTNSYDTDLWIAGTTRTNPTNNSQGLYIQHRVAGDLGGLVNDAGASELRLSGVSNTGAGQAAHENSLVITGGVNAAGTLIGCLANFHTSGTPTGTVNEVSLFRASQIPPLPGGFTVARAVGLVVDQQIVGTENFSVYAPDGGSVFGPIVAKDAAAVALTARGVSGQTASIMAVQNSSPTTLFRIDANGTGGFGGTVSGVTAYVNNNLATGGTPVLAVKGHASQTAPLTQWRDSGDNVRAYIASNGDIRAVNQTFAVRNSADSATLWSAGVAGPRWNDVSLQQTTVGAAGAASALPATPTKYLKVQDSAGTTLVVPAYAAS